MCHRFPASSHGRHFLRCGSLCIYVTSWCHILKRVTLFKDGLSVLYWQTGIIDTLLLHQAEAPKKGSYEISFQRGTEVWSASPLAGGIWSHVAEREEAFERLLARELVVCNASLASNHRVWGVGLCVPEDWQDYCAWDGQGQGQRTAPGSSPPVAPGFA